MRVGGADLAIVNRVGKGRAVYLNALLDRDGPSRDAWRTVLRAVLGDAGVRPAVSVTDPSGRPVTQVRVARYRFGGHEVVALLSGQLEVKTSFGRDGVTVFENAEGRVVRHEVDVALPRVAAVTNARTGEALGETARLRTTLTAGDALVLALGVDREPLRLEGPARAKRGEAPAFTAVAPSAARRLLRWHVRGPGGVFLPEYAQVTVEDGATAAFVLPSALDDAPGEYRVRVTDVLSGASAECGAAAGVAGSGLESRIEALANDGGPVLNCESRRSRQGTMTRLPLAVSLLALLGCGSSSGDGPPAGASPTPAPNSPVSTSSYFPPDAAWYRDVSAAALDPQSAAVIANLDRVGWGLGRMQIDFSIEVLAADATTPLRAFTPTADHFRPDCDLDPSRCRRGAPWRARKATSVEATATATSSSWTGRE